MPRTGRCCRFLNIGASARFLAFHQAQHACDFEAILARRLNRLDVDAPVVHTSSTMTTRAPFSRKPSMRCPVPCVFSALRTRKPLIGDPLLRADHRRRDHDGVGAHGQAADCIGFQPRRESPPAPLRRWPQRLRVQCGQPAVNVVVAGASAGEREISQAKRLLRQHPQ